MHYFTSLIKDDSKGGPSLAQFHNLARVFCEGNVFVRLIAGNDTLRGERSGDRVLVVARFSAPVQTGRRAQPVFCTTDNWPLSRGVKRQGRGV
jgi:hypothetical protein